MDKYAGGYFDHFLAMYSVNFEKGKNTVKLDTESFQEMIEMYTNIEGEEAFKALVQEIKEIRVNNDWTYFSHLELNKFSSSEDVQKIGEFIINQ